MIARYLITCCVCLSAIPDPVHAESPEAPEFIGSITGRLIDSADGTPLTGDAPTYAVVQLKLCQETCEGTQTLGFADEAGRFVLSGADRPPGTYQLLAYVSGYQGGTTSTFEVASGEHFEFGDFAIDRDAVELGSGSVCEAVPVQGGVCRFSANVRNLTGNRFLGKAWASVFFVLPDATVQHFIQVGSGGTANPRPLPVILKPRRQARLTFAFHAPDEWAALDEGGAACVLVEVGRGPDAELNAATYGLFLGCLARDGTDLTMLVDENSSEAVSRLAKGHAGSGRRSVDWTRHLRGAAK